MMLIASDFTLVSVVPSELPCILVVDPWPSHIHSSRSPTNNHKVLLPLYCPLPSSNQFTIIIHEPRLDSMTASLLSLPIECITDLTRDPSPLILRAPTFSLQETLPTLLYYRHRSISSDLSMEEVSTPKEPPRPSGRWRSACLLPPTRSIRPS